MVEIRAVGSKDARVIIVGLLFISMQTIWRDNFIASIKKNALLLSLCVCYFQTLRIKKMKKDQNLVPPLEYLSSIHLHLW
jgi:hypothetical protein